jgi:hypothetical protein
VDKVATGQIVRAGLDEAQVSIVEAFLSVVASVRSDAKQSDG